MTARLRIAHYLLITSLFLSLTAGSMFCFVRFLELTASYIEPSNYEKYSGVVSEVTKGMKGGYLLTIQTSDRKIKFAMLCGFKSITIGESISIGSIDKTNGLTLSPPTAAILIKDGRELCRGKYVDYQNWKASKPQKAFIFFLSLSIIIICTGIAILFVRKPISANKP